MATSFTGLALKSEALRTFTTGGGSFGEFSGVRGPTFHRGMTVDCDNVVRSPADWATLTLQCLRHERGRARKLRTREGLARRKDPAEIARTGCHEGQKPKKKTQQLHCEKVAV